MGHGKQQQLGAQAASQHSKWDRRQSEAGEGVWAACAGHSCCKRSWSLVLCELEHARGLEERSGVAECVFLKD